MDRSRNNVVLKKLSGDDFMWWAWEVSIDGVRILVDFESSCRNLAHNLARDPDFCRETLARAVMKEVHEI